jgi:hypothetical protein
MLTSIGMNCGGGRDEWLAFHSSPMFFSAFSFVHYRKVHIFAVSIAEKWAN